MPAAIRPAGPGDLDAVADILTGAFLADPVWGALSFPDPATQRDVSRPFWAFCARSMMRFPHTYVTTGLEAVAVWIPPGEPELTDEQEEELGALLDRLLGASQAAVVFDVFDRLNAAHPHEEPHHYLSLLGTHEDHRGHGHGMALLAACLEQIDAEGAPAYLESTNPANDARYSRHGFERRGTVRLPAGPEIATMWRPSR
jgi:GNAT superfamily N-acetyltransferase